METMERVHNFKFPGTHISDLFCLVNLNTVYLTDLSVHWWHFRQLNASVYIVGAA